MKDKKILVWTKKGGCGKTNISAELSMRFNYPAITNEPSSMLSHIISGDRLKILEANEVVPNYDVGMIYDFGGYIDFRIADVAKTSDFTIIPTLPEASDIQACIHTIQEIKKHTDRIIVIANKTEAKGDYETVKQHISDICDYPVFEIKKSRALPNIYLEKKSIGEMMEASPLLRYSYKKVKEQFDILTAYIKNN